VDDLGGAFAMGAIGGSVFHLGRGFRNSPRGYRLLGGYNALVLRAPTLGGNFAAWGGLLSAYDCLLVKVRDREDPLNAITAGALTGATLAIRNGAREMGKSALVGGVLLAFFEGISLMVSKYMVPEQPPMTPTLPPNLPTPNTLKPNLLGDFRVDDFSFEDVADIAEEL
jgi:import inner membrane translocase subunit TIM17